MKIYEFFQSESLCMWCGWKFKISMSPFNAAEFRKWVENNKQHRIDCKNAFIQSEAAVKVLNECGMYFMSKGDQL